MRAETNGLAYVNNIRPFSVHQALGSPLPAKSATKLILKISVLLSSGVEVAGQKHKAQRQPLPTAWVRPGAVSEHFLRVLTTGYLQRCYRSAVRNFSDVPGKPSPYPSGIGLRR